MNNEAHDKRFSVTLPEALHEELTSFIPWGVKNSIIICLLMRFLDVMKKEGRNSYVSVLNREFEIHITTKDHNRKRP